MGKIEIVTLGSHEDTRLPADPTEPRTLIGGGGRGWVPGKAGWPFLGSLGWELSVGGLGWAGGLCWVGGLGWVGGLVGWLLTNLPLYVIIENVVEIWAQRTSPNGYPFGGPVPPLKISPPIKY